MAEATLLLEPGIYFAGIDRPWYASKGAVRAELEKRFGLRNVTIYPRRTPLPAGVQPTTDPRYQNSWDEWLRAEYSGPVVSVSSERLWSWLIKVRAAAVTPQIAHVAPEPIDPPSVGGLVLVAVPAAIGLWLWSRSR